MTIGIEETLKHLYRYHDSLLELLKVPLPSCAVFHPGDSQRYRDVLSTTLVACNRSESELQSLKFKAGKMMELRELIYLAIEIQLKKTRSHSSNVLSLGFEFSVGGDGVQVGAHYIEEKFTNAMATSLNSPEFQLLHERIGDDAMLFLLLHCSLFASIENGNFFQLTGSPVHSLISSSQPSSKSYEGKKQRKRKRSDSPDTCGRSGKKSKKAPCRRAGDDGDVERLPVDQKTSTMTTKERSILQNCFSRKTMYYASCMREGLECKYTLNKLGASTNGARKLVTEVFQSETCPNRSRKMEGKPKTKTKPIRLTSRMRGIIPIFKKLISNYKKCRFIHLVHHHCPLPEEWKKFKEAGEEKRLTSLYSTHKQVFCFIRSVLKSVVPKELFGSEVNEQQFLKHLCQFVELRKYEQMSVRQFLVGLKLSHCDWLKSAGQGRHTPLTSSVKQLELLSKWIYWLVNSLVIKTLKAFFYVTDHSSYRNQMLFYRKPVWSRVVKSAMQEKKNVMLSAIQKQDVTQLLSEGKALGVSKMRYLPKTSGVRPIVNLSQRRASSKTKPDLTINCKLSNAFHVLSSEKRYSARAFGSSVHGMDDIYKLWKPFALRERVISLSRCDSEPLLFVNVDISNCFDSIDTKKLYQTLEKLMQRREFYANPNYLIRRYVSTVASNSRMIRSFKKLAVTDAEYVSFDVFARQLSTTTSLRNAILTDQVLHLLEAPSEFLNLLKKHLFCNIVETNGQYYKQVNGIPQGSVLSSLLCSLYYGAMEEECLPDIGPYDLLMRLVDDFLLITRNKELAKKFYTTMKNGIPEYNCYINSEKTVANFQLTKDGDVEVLSNVQWIPWCGLLINTKCLDVCWNYSFYKEIDIRDTMTVVTHFKPFHSLRQKTIQSLILKCHPMLLDCDVLQHRTVYRNIYQCFILAALKFQANVKAICKANTKNKYSKFFIAIVSGCIHSFYAAAKRRCVWEGSLESTFSVSFHDCSWLAHHAFLKVLKRKKGKECLLMKLISHKLENLAKQVGDVSLLKQVTSWNII